MGEFTAQDNQLPKDVRVRLQRNYIIIKSLWNVVMEGKPMEAFYKRVHMHRNKYGALVSNDDHRNPHMKGIAETLSSESGAEEAVFLGEKAIEVTGISDTEWDEYFVCMDNKNYADKKDKNYKRQCREDKEKIRAFNQKLTAALKNTLVIVGVDMNLYKLYFWTEHKTAYKGDIPTIKLEQVAKMIKDIKFQDLTSYCKEPNADIFEAYYRLLEEHTQQAKVVLDYYYASNGKSLMQHKAGTQS